MKSKISDGFNSVNKIFHRGFGCLLGSLGATGFVFAGGVTSPFPKAWKSVTAFAQDMSDGDVMTSVRELNEGEEGMSAAYAISSVYLGSVARLNADGLRLVASISDRHMFAYRSLVREYPELEFDKHPTVE